MPEEAEDVAREVKNSRTLRILARVGFAMSGLLHIIIGGIAISLVAGARGSQPSRSGAFSWLLAVPGGEFVLWIIVVGLVALGLWLILRAILVADRDPRRRWAHRVGAGSRAFAYLFIGVTALLFALGGRTNTARSSRDISAALLAAPGGILVIAAVGAGVLVAGGFFIVKGASTRFTADLRMPAGAARVAALCLGCLGYIAKGAVLCAVGVLIMIGAFTYSPGESAGLDGALKTLAALPAGGVILYATGIGLIVYGLYGVLRATLARL